MLLIMIILMIILRFNEYVLFILLHGIAWYCLDIALVAQKVKVVNEDRCDLKKLGGGDGSVIGRVRRVGFFYFGTERVGYLPKSSGTRTGRDG